MPEQPRLDTIQKLAEQLRRIEHSQPKRAPARLVSTGLSVLDDLLPDGGIQPGSIIEWLSPGPGSGAATLAFVIAAWQMRDGGTLVVIDPQAKFYPPAAANLDIDLDRTIVVRPGNTKDTLWSLEQTLRCASVAVAICHLDHLDDRVFRRLQLAAETGGGLGLFLRPDRYREQPSWADVRLRVRGQGGERSVISSQRGKKSAHFSPLTSPPFPYERLLQLELLRSHNSNDNKTILIGIDDETGSVRLVSELASATSLPRAAGA